MARTDAVWGIDIGQCALKALRCRPGSEPGTIVAEAFDYIEYPKILSQPEADPGALVAEAIKQFLSRNSVRGDRVAISVPGQNGLARFIKLPPVESKKIPDIVKYEARQQIPFSLEDVVWDYQKMVGGSEEEGFALETEVGLFAMKRDQVYRALKPFTDAAIEIDYVQLSPLALYNFVAFDQLPDLPASEYDPENPPPSVAMLSLGTDSTDLVVTNGFRVWQRSVPIGGNHFTKALTKELKLTFATAEHLKRNAAKAEDPKALFQAMRPVFNDLLTEVQRSLSYFSNLDRRASIGRVLALGNAMKLPGLQRYLGQNLGFEFGRVESFAKLTGPSVVDAPTFKENVLSFAPCYGLALQGLKQARIKTNLIPRELLKDRMIRAKKPWAVGAAAAVLLGCTISYFGYWRTWSSVKLDGYFAPALGEVERTVTQAKGYQSAFQEAQSKYKKTGGVSQSLTLSDERRLRWVQVLTAINACLPRDEGAPSEKLEERNEIHIRSIQAQHIDDLALWYGEVRSFDVKEPTPPSAADAAAPADGSAPADPAAAAPQPPAETATAADANDTGPSGAGWIIEMRGYHYHNDQLNGVGNGDIFVRKTLFRNLRAGKVVLPKGDGADAPVEIDLKELGLGYPILLPVGKESEFPVDWNYEIDAPEEPGAGGQPKRKIAPRFDFIVQLCWRDAPQGKPAEGEEADQSGRKRRKRGGDKSGESRPADVATEPATPAPTPAGEPGTPAAEPSPPAPAAVDPAAPAAPPTDAAPAAPMPPAGTPPSAPGADAAPMPPATPPPGGAPPATAPAPAPTTPPPATP